MLLPAPSPSAGGHCPSAPRPPKAPPLGKLTHAPFSLQGPKGDRGSPGEKVGAGLVPRCRWGRSVAAGALTLASSRASEAKMEWGCLAPPACLAPPDRSSTSRVKT